jgi:hypothetical protein
MSDIIDIGARVIGGIVTGGLSEVLPNDPILGRKKGIIGRGAGRALTLGLGDPGRQKQGALPGLRVGKSPSAEDTAVQQAVAEANRRRQRGRGFRETILSQLMPKDATALGETIGT